MEQNENRLPTPDRIDLNWVNDLLSGNNMNYYVQLISTTRSYEIGLQITSTSLEILEKNRSRIALPAYCEGLSRLAQHLLHMLDCLDNWELYLLAYEQTEAKFVELKKVTPSPVLGTLPFWRREVIVRKLERKASGKNIKSDFHHSKALLSQKEMSDRIDHLNHIFRMLRDSEIYHNM